jgi:hypothetical protein
MNDKQKNVLTNIIGIVLLGINVYAFYWKQLDLLDFCVVLCLSLALFLFKANNTKLWLKKALKGILSKFSQ